MPLSATILYFRSLYVTHKSFIISDVSLCLYFPSFLLLLFFCILFLARSLKMKIRSWSPKIIVGVHHLQLSAQFKCWVFPRNILFHTAALLASFNSLHSRSWTALVTQLFFYCYRKMLCQHLLWWTSTKCHLHLPISIKTTFTSTASLILHWSVSEMPVPNFPGMSAKLLSRRCMMYNMAPQFNELSMHIFTVGRPLLASLVPSNCWKSSYNLNE